MFSSTGLLMALARVSQATIKNSKQLQVLTLTNSLYRFSTSASMFAQRNSPSGTEEKISQPSQVFVTLPNILTASRIALTPAIGYFIWNGMSNQALCCFTLAALTDLADGYLARKLNQCSPLGAILDPIADKLLMTTSFITLFKVGLMPGWLVGGFIGRDLALLVGGACLRYLHLKDKSSSTGDYLDFSKHPMPQFKPTLVSKCNTALQCSLIFLHLGACQVVGIQLDNATIVDLHILTACTTAISFGQYLSRPFFSLGTTAHKD